MQEFEKGWIFGYVEDIERFDGLDGPIRVLGVAVIRGLEGIEEVYDIWEKKIDSRVKESRELNRDKTSIYINAIIQKLFFIF